MDNASIVQTVLLADDHPVFLSGIRGLFELRGDFEIVAEAQNGSQCITLLKELQPDWAVIDLAMPHANGFDVLSGAMTSSPQTKIIILSMYAEHAYAKQAQELGAVGFITKEDAVSELEKALSFTHGEFFKGRSVGKPSLRPVDKSSDSNLQSLTPTERKILHLIGKGHTSKEIAGSLDVSPRTVQKHRENMASKLGLFGPNRLLEFAIRNFKKLKS